MTERSHRLVRSLSEKIESLEIEFHEAYWQSQIEASPETDARRAELEIELRKVKGDAEALEQINRALADGIHDPILKRQLEVLRLSFTGNQMSDEAREEVVALSTAVESDFASFRPVVDGERMDDNQITEVLKTSDDNDYRKKVWQASKEVGSVVADRVRELVRVRNASARELGFADYYRMELELQEIEEDWLFGVMSDLEEMTDEPFRKWKGSLDANLAQRFGTTDLYPWHYADPFFQYPPADGRVSMDPLLAGVDAERLAVETFKAWDIDLTGVMERSDLYPRERKCQHAFCLQMDRLDDVRILANIVPGERWTETMLHESGHAAYDICIDRKLPYTLRRPTHTFVTEAIALLSGRMTLDPAWLKTFAGVPAEAIDPVADQVRRAGVDQQLQFARWGLVMVHFERDMYADPEGDLDPRWWEYVARFQHVPIPAGAAPEGAWASKIHIAVAPVYYHNYLLGDLLASQLTATAKQRFGAVVGVPETGAWLKETIFRPGDSMRWSDVVEASTGRPLGAQDFAADLST